MPKLYR